MSDDKKDKIIYGLIIAVFILIANFAYSNNMAGIFDKSDKVSLVDEDNLDEDQDIDSKKEESTNDSIKKFIYQAR